jgi:hypothetical protein
MEKTRVVFRTGRKLGMTIAIFPDTIDGDEILAYDKHHYMASKSSIMKHTRPATVDEWEDLFFELKHHYKYEFLSIRKRCVKRKRHGN